MSSRKPIVVLHESFRKLVEKFNVLSNNVGDPVDLNTYNDSDLVTVINEIDATFDAHQGEIIYPNPDVPFRTAAQLPNTHLKISTNQSGGTDIDIDAGQDFLVDAVRHINLTSVNFDGDYSGTYINKVDGTSLDSVGGAITVTGNSTYNLTTGGNFTQTTTGNIILDATGDITLDADGNDIIFKNGQGGDTVTHNLADDGDYTVSSPNHYTVDAEGDIILDADGNDIIFKNGAGNDQVTHNINNNGNYSINAPADMYLNTVGDIILNADGNAVIFRNNESGSEDSARITLDNAGNLVFSVLGYLTFDVERDIVLDAKGDNITLKDGGTTRQEYTLGATNTIATTGNRTETVTGDVSDSAAGTYHIGATGNMDIDTRGTLLVNTGGNNVQYTTGHIDLNATQNIVLDAGGDIYLDAGDSDIHMQRNSDTFARWNMGIPGDANAFQLKVEKGDFHVDASGDISLDAGDSDIIFKRNGTTFAKWQMGIDGYPTYTRQSYPYGSLGIQAATNVTIDAGHDIILEANGGDVFMKDGATEYLRFTHAGNGNAGIDNNGIRVINFEDSDAVFENDVNIEGDLDVDLTLNVDGATTLNANVTLGNAATDQISATGQFVTSLVPLTDDDYSIGAVSKEWKHGYFDGTVFADNLDGDSGTIANFNIKDNTISGSSGINLDATGDITLNAKGDDIIFEGTFNGVDSSRVHFDLGNNQSSVVQRVVNRNLVLEVDKNIYLDANEGLINLRDSASQTRVQFDYNHALSAGTEMKVYGGSLTMDVSGDIVLDADGGDVVLKDGGTQFGRFENVSDNLKVYSGPTTAMTFSGANVTMAGQITLPSSDLDTTEKTVHGAINEVDSDLGERTSLSSFYDGNKEDIVTALNRVAARVVDIYDVDGTLLNS